MIDDRFSSLGCYKEYINTLDHATGIAIGPIMKLMITVTVVHCLLKGMRHVSLSKTSLPYSGCYITSQMIVVVSLSDDHMLSVWSKIYRSKDRVK